MRTIFLILLIIAGISRVGTFAEEGMWTFDNPPLEQLKTNYGFNPTPEWLEHIRLSCPRINDGGSSSFVSGEGLLLTNHHVALGQIQKLSTADKNYVADGYLAKTRAEELRCPDLEVLVLCEMKDVTAEVMRDVKPGMDAESALRARKAAMAKIERESRKKTGLHSEVITLYNGAEYWLYRYRKYTDIHLVFAPEQQIAFYGGDDDNFTYPRYDLDMTLLRVYENGKPLKTPHHLKWKNEGASEDELVFIVGNPGRTDRLKTLAYLDFQRNRFIPDKLESMNSLMAVLHDYSRQSAEHARQAAGLRFGLENSIKAYTGMLSGLNDEHLMEIKRDEENRLRSAMEENPELAEFRSVWSDMEKLLAEYQKIYSRHLHYSTGYAKLFRYALHLVQYAAEIKKPDGKRLKGFHESELESFRLGITSSAPVYQELDAEIASWTLSRAQAALGADDPFIRAALGGRDSRELCTELAGATRLHESEFRRQLLAGGPSAIEKCQDPLLQWARKIDPFIRQIIHEYEELYESKLIGTGEKLGQLRFRILGKNSYPDANFTLRLTFGTVKGYPMNGTRAPVQTTFYGLFDRYHGFNGQEGYALPERFLQRIDQLNLSQPLNFVSTCDIIGGNSGSPVINREGELVGLVFDGNIESLPGRFAYDITRNRAVSVHAGAMIHALRVLYDAAHLADEVEGTQ